MPCERCQAQFTLLRRKRWCSECGRHFCGGCVQRVLQVSRPVCASCRLLLSRPLAKRALEALRVRDLQCFLHEHKVSTAGCVEKEDLVNLVVTHVNSSDFVYRTPSQNTPNDPFITFDQIKSFTTNLYHQTFDTSNEKSHGKNKQNSQGSQNAQNKSGSSNNNAQPSNPECPTTSYATQHTEQPTPVSMPSGSISSPKIETNIPPLQIPQCIVTDTSTNNASNERVELTDTNDCLEIEDDPDDPDWEMVASPLPQDSEILLLDNNVPLRSSQRAASDLDIPSRSTDDSSDTCSFKETPIITERAPRININDLKNLSEVEDLSVKQLKELLILNRVDFKGCCERKELLERAKRLWRENTKSREDLESSATNEEWCKICMDAPMECVMLECGHIATCLNCGKRLSECPICREYVVRVVRFFRS